MDGCLPTNHLPRTKRKLYGATKHCSYGKCNSDSRYPDRPAMAGVHFVHFPSTKRWLQKCKKWVEACKRQNFTLDNVKRYSYICSLHFVGGKGPTLANPDPIPASMSTAKMLKLTKHPRNPPKCRSMPEVNRISPTVSRKTLPASAKTQESVSSPDCLLNQESSINSINESIPVILGSDIDPSTCTDRNLDEAMDQFVDFKPAIQNNHDVGTQTSFPANAKTQECVSSPDCLLNQESSINSINESIPVILGSDIDPSTCMDRNLDEAMEQFVDIKPAIQNNHDVGTQTPLLMSDTDWFTCIQMEHIHYEDNWNLSFTDSSTMVFHQMKGDFALKRVTIQKNGEYTVEVLGKIVTHTWLQQVSTALPLICSRSQLSQVLSVITHLHVCSGNSEYLRFNDIAAESRPMNYDYCRLSNTVRSKLCSIFTTENRKRCHNCDALRDILRKRDVRSSVINKKRKLSDLSHQDLLATARTQKKLLRATTLKLERLRTKFNRTTDNGLALTELDNSDFLKVLQDNISRITKNNTLGMMLHDQLKAASCTTQKTMRWNPTILKLCADVRNKSCSGYEALRKSGLINLPCSRTFSRHGVVSNSPR